METGFTLRKTYMNDTPLAHVEKWKDTESDSVGFLAVQSWRNGAAGGGTRICGFDSDDDACTTAINLAKTMELKFRVAGPDIGGAKSVIRYVPEPESVTSAAGYDPKPHKEGVLRRWLTSIWPSLKDRYGTGGDLGVDDATIIRLFGEVSRTIEPGSAAFTDPQQGIVYGFYRDHHEERLKSLRSGVPQPVEEVGLRLAAEAPKILDLITGFGVAEATRRFYELRGQDLSGKRVLVEGFGNVGAAAAYFLAEAGARICGVITLDPDERRGDKDDDVPKRRLCVTSDSGLDVKDLIRARSGTNLGSGERLDAGDQSFWDTPADLFIPAAASGTIDEARLRRLLKAGVGLISPGANVPFVSTDVEEAADSELSVIPDFIANCGMARAYAHFMERWSDSDTVSRWPSLTADVETIIGDALSRIHSPHGPPTGYLERAYRHYIGQTLGPDR
ncbi:MAG TPA: hypothetical protein VEW25_06390 [Allosphingosinicella sp.]|nr:hypothetical protein [Allosphingosinicella sp.]